MKAGKPQAFYADDQGAWPSLRGRGRGWTLKDKKEDLDGTPQRSYTHEVSSTWLLKHDMNKEHQ